MDDPSKSIPVPQRPPRGVPAGSCRQQCIACARSLAQVLIMGRLCASASALSCALPHFWLQARRWATPACWLPGLTPPPGSTAWSTTWGMCRPRSRWWAAWGASRERLWPPVELPTRKERRRQQELVPRLASLAVGRRCLCHVAEHSLPALRATPGCCPIGAPLSRAAPAGAAAGGRRGWGGVPHSRGTSGAVAYNHDGRPCCLQAGAGAAHHVGGWPAGPVQRQPGHGGGWGWGRPQAGGACPGFMPDRRRCARLPCDSTINPTH